MAKPLNGLKQEHKARLHLLGGPVLLIVKKLAEAD
jgi:hypothetical protein